MFNKTSILLNESISLTQLRFFIICRLFSYYNNDNIVFDVNLNMLFYIVYLTNYYFILVFLITIVLAYFKMLTKNCYTIFPVRKSLQFFFICYNINQFQYNFQMRGTSNNTICFHIFIRYKITNDCSYSHIYTPNYVKVWI